MNVRRYLIDDVCLWCARLFAVVSLLAMLLTSWIAFAPARWARWTPLDSLRACELVSIILLSVLWLVGLWTLRNKTSRWLVGVSAALYLILICWRLRQGAGFIGEAEAAFSIVSLLGLVSMLWVALRPPGPKPFSN